MRLDKPAPGELLLHVDSLRTHFFTDQGVLPSVDGVSFTVNAGEVVGIVGESGSGKSVMSMSILRLIPSPPGRIVGGRIEFLGRDLTKISDAEMRRVRGNDIAVIFQEPMTSLNPVFTVGDQIAEAVMLHQEKDEDEARDIAIRMLESVGIPSPETRVDSYPHQLSGGMKQRVMIAMALACKPALLIADEPTTALDVTIQAQILDLLDKIRDEHGMAILLITHDLGVVAEHCDKVVVMYAGKVVESAPTAELFENPIHPYTRGLLASLPGLAPAGARLPTIPGMVPSPLDFPTGCRFRSTVRDATPEERAAGVSAPARCPRADAACADDPPLVSNGPDHQAWCHHPLGRVS